MILITGASGHLGKDTIDFLLKKLPANQIKAMVRDIEKNQELKDKGIDLVQGDYFNYDSLVNAFAGIDKLLFISSGTIQDRTKQHENVVKAAKEAGVKHVIYTSVLNPQPNPIFFPGVDHTNTEEFLKESGLTYTFLRNCFYHEVLPQLIDVKTALESGKIYYPASNGKISLASRVDMAEATANVLASEGHENKIYNISTAEPYSINDYANILSELSGKKIEYINISEEEFKKQLIAHNVPEGFIAFVLATASAIKNNEINYSDTTLEKLLGHPTLTLKEFLKNNFF